MKASTTAVPPEPIVIRTDTSREEMLDREWLLTNSVGAYSSSTVLGCNTRRYHGLLVAPVHPPVGRFCALSTVMEELTVNGQLHKLAVNEFRDAFGPSEGEHLAEFRNDAAATFVFHAGGATLTKEVVLADSASAVAVRYTLSGASAALRLRPFVALRDFHHLRDGDADGALMFEQEAECVAVRNRQCPDYAVYLSSSASFEAEGQWWRQFMYRGDIARGQDSGEDLYSPGSFVCELADGQSCMFAAAVEGPPCVDFEAEVATRSRRLSELAASAGAGADELTRRLAAATNTFIVRRSFPVKKGGTSASIMAGYHWFADWGRDTFIALPGLLLSTGRFDLAKRVFRTFAEHMSNGMIPNRFDDYGGSAHYNSIDASLWFIIAAERYVQATGDMDFWKETLLPACETVLAAYQSGTLFDIRSDGDGLLSGGNENTQLTWMDVKFGDQAITPRHGKAVEINAMWHSAHRILAERCRPVDQAKAEKYANTAELIAAAFEKNFWNDTDNCLYDCISLNGPDASIRPNQIFAVSLPHSPLDIDRQKAVVSVVTAKLLTPVGLRTLAADDRQYRGKYGPSWESRDRAYHQGTVWAWLMGGFIEAYLKVEGGKPFAVAQAKQWLDGFAPHLLQGGLGFISEIFDGNSPHHHRGCIAQAWSVAEVLRAKLLVQEYE